MIINDIVESSEKDKETTNQWIYSKYASDLLSNVPSCVCGKTYGEHLKNDECPKCHTIVTPSIEPNLEPFLWVRAPKGIPALINPHIWTLLNHRFTKSHFEVIRWICDTTYQPPINRPLVIEELTALNIPRGYINFVSNFDTIMQTLFNLRDFKVRKDEEDDLQELLKVKRDCIFCQYIPIPNKSILIVDSNSQGNIVDPMVTNIVNAVRIMVGIDTEDMEFSLKVRENRTIKTIVQLAEINQNIVDNQLAKKEGVFRKQVYGSRSHFSFRAVISSITKRHDYRQIEIPWGVGATVYQLHLINKLDKMGYTVKEALTFINAYTQTYHPLLDQLFQELIKEAGPLGDAATLTRNPSLQPGSVQQTYIGCVKTNIYDQTVGLSILITKLLNADFDGRHLPCLSFLIAWESLRAYLATTQIERFNVNA